MSKSMKHFIRGITPLPFYFAVTFSLPLALMKYTVIGPVSDGQPVFESYPAVLTNSLIGLALLGYFFSLYQSTKVHGRAKFVLITMVTLFLPLQYLAIVGLQITLFGK